MNTADRLIEYMRSKNGVTSAKDAVAEGFSYEGLRRAVQVGLIEKWARGLYALPETFDDEMFALQQRYARGIYSHGTALYLHGLSDRIPTKYQMTFPEHYNTHRLPRELVEVFFSGKDLHESGVVSIDTVFGHKVFAYAPERTLCDMLRPHVNADVSIVSSAFNKWAKSPTADIAKMSKYSKLLKVEDKVRSYLEILL